MNSNPHYEARRELRGACDEMLGYIETQLDEDDALAPAEREAAPVLALRRALAADDDQELASAGAAAAEWITRNASEEERFDWAVNCPHPAIDRFEVATAWLADP
jgi:hypothetical protein